MVHLLHVVFAKIVHCVRLREHAFFFFDPFVRFEKILDLIVNRRIKILKPKDFDWIITWWFDWLSCSLRFVFLWLISLILSSIVFFSFSNLSQSLEILLICEFFSLIKSFRSSILTNTSFSSDFINSANCFDYFKVNLFLKDFILEVELFFRLFRLSASWDQPMFHWVWEALRRSLSIHC